MPIVLENPSEIWLFLKFYAAMIWDELRAHFTFKIGRFIVKLLVLCPFYCFSIIRPFLLITDLITR